MVISKLPKLLVDHTSWHERDMAEAMERTCTHAHGSGFLDMSMDRRVALGYTSKCQPKFGQGGSVDKNSKDHFVALVIFIGASPALFPVIETISVTVGLA